MDELRAWTEENPGRFAYPAPPDFTGNAFVEQALYDVTGQVDAYQKPFDEEVFEEESGSSTIFWRRSNRTSGARARRTPRPRPSSTSSTRTARSG
jgi:ABC-type uncharacterized transport system YnjBCD substrate-binding protein